MMATPERWTYRLSDADVAEIENAATMFIDSGRPLGLITATCFPSRNLVSGLKICVKP